MKNEKGTEKIVRISFDVGFLIKGIDALAEIIGGIALIFLTPDRLNTLITLISKGELSEDPTAFLMNYLVIFGHSFSVSSSQFVMFYLLSHGIVKMIVILSLWYKKPWAYPLSVVVVVFVLFIAYQMYHYTISHSIFLLLLTVLDIIMIVLTILEYKRIKKELKG